MPYSLCILSPIPVVRKSSGFATLDLWARDLDAQISHLTSLKLICPVVDSQPINWSAVESLNKSITVFPAQELPVMDIRSALSECDIVQLPGGQSWHDSWGARQILRVCSNTRVKIVIGISSNRVRTAILNTSGGSWLRRILGLIKAGSIWCS